MAAIQSTTLLSGGIFHITTGGKKFETGTAPEDQAERLSGARLGMQGLRQNAEAPST